MGGEVGKRPSGRATSADTGVLGADRDAVVDGVDVSSPLRWSIRARVGLSRPAVISGRRMVPPPKTVTPCAVAEERGRLVGGGRYEHVGSHGRDSKRAPHTRCAATEALDYAPFMAFASIDELELALAEASYLTDRGLATALYLAVTLGKPLLLEGEAGVGKTEAAKAIARLAGASLIRLQCYEGLDVTNAVYEWNYARQLLHIRAAQAGTVDEARALRRASS